MSRPMKQPGAQARGAAAASLASTRPSRLQGVTVLRPKRLALLLGTLGLACAHAAPGSERGTMVDNSATFTAQPPRSSEREGREFDTLSPSALTVAERQVMLETPAPVTPPVTTVLLQDTLSGTNFESGRAVLLPEALARLDALADKVRGHQKIRFEIVGHTDTQRISARLKPTYPDNQALSEARALAVAAYLKHKLSLQANAFSTSGRGPTQPVASNDTPEGMAQNRRTEIRAWYEAPVVQADQPAPVQAPREVVRYSASDRCAMDAGPVQPFSISVDGVPLGQDSAQFEADRQRCVDVALEKSGIQVRYDPMQAAPALNAWSMAPAAVRGQAHRFANYTNYAFWLRRAELRLFVQGQDTRATPYAVVPVQLGAATEWSVPADAPDRLTYLLRVYDAGGRFDETQARDLPVLDRLPAGTQAVEGKLDGYGVNARGLNNIRVAGGSVTISGDQVAAGQRVFALGTQLPVDASGKFATRQILPAGPHTVEVSVRDADGLGTTFSRNLSIADRDWFYVAMADLTAGRNNTSGPIELVTGDDRLADRSTWIDGRGAFYLKGKIKGDTLLTASADTREQPLKDLFSNFSSKDPNYLLRRIDPDRYYPVYGDDSTISDDAPTMGKLYVRLERQDASVMWGNFRSAWTGTELTQFTRGLYGANLQWNSQASVATGDKASSVNVFAAEPGTLPAREEFRGTGGSLYYMRHQDITMGSERLWIEIRDRDSGMPLERRALVAAQDYEINYLQGRVMLRTPLASVAAARSLVQTASVNGNPAYLVASYEYVPGLQAVSGSVAGLRASHWFNDHVQLGLSGYRQGEDMSRQDLRGLDAMLRHSANTWIKAEAARSDGAAGTLFSSISGGYDFNTMSGGGQRADGRRVQAALDLKQIGAAGQLNAYWLDRDGGFSAPGQITANGEAQRQSGLDAAVPLSEHTEFALKADQRDSTLATARSAEAMLRYRVTPEWGLSAAVRRDTRESSYAVPTASPLLNQQGSRSDAIIRIDWRPAAEGDETVRAAQGSSSAAPAAAASSAAATSMAKAGAPRRDGGLALAAGIAATPVPGVRYRDWSLYGFVQQTLARDGTRARNDRAGVGASWQASSRLQLGAELSGGSGGAGGQLNANWRTSERSDVYLTYALETENPNLNYAGRQGTMTGGSHFKLNDKAALFAETRWQNGAGPESLTRAFGVDLAPAENWSLNLKTEFGTLSDPLAGDMKRRAVGATASWQRDGKRFSTGLEYRIDRSASILPCVDGSADCGSAPAAGTINNGERRSWLWRNALGMQLDPAWRLQGKLNLARSEASQGAFFDGDYTEAVLAAAYRPVANDRWNALFKYTYFYNLPSPAQVDHSFNTPLDYRQKSHVLNVDAIYDVKPWLSLGAKYGVRMGKLSPSRTSDAWYDSRAHLAVLRADVHFTRELDGIAEMRRLSVRETKDSRSGALLGVYRHIGAHAKAGIGYNFTDFSDDLTDLSYRNRGWFINVLGKF
jgi:outer membrane protein OmpA-like peptidoglycan-associated protein